MRSHCRTVTHTLTPFSLKTAPAGRGTLAVPAGLGLAGLGLAALGLAALGLAACGGGQGLGTSNNTTPTDGGPRPDAVTPADGGSCGVGDDEKVLGAAARIYNGTTDPEICMSAAQQRAVGALLFQSYNWDNGCTGTLIAEDVVITAAHCVRDWRGNLLSASEVRFAVGPNAAQPEHVFQVASVASHPQYQGEAPHDVGVLVLAETITEAGLDIVPIPANTTSLASGFLGEWVQNVGFGSTESNDNNHRRYWTTEEVTQVLAGEYVVYGQGESSVCYGDSGGPSLFLFGGTSLAVTGTVSWGDPSCVDYDHFCRADDNQAFLEGYTGPVDPCQGIDSAGRCDGDVALWCEGGRLQQQCCGAAGYACVQNGDGESRCNDVCQGLTFQGRCEGNDAVWCEGGQIRRRRCDPCGQICGWAGDPLGNYCIDP